MNVVTVQGNFKNDEERVSLLSAAPQAIMAAPTLDEAKRGRTAYINAMREQACEEVVQALGHAWQADKRSKELLNGAISLAQAGLSLPSAWRTSDNVSVPITGLTDLLAIAGSIAAQTQTAYQHSWDLKSQVATALTFDAVYSIIW